MIFTSKQSRFYLPAALLGMMLLLFCSITGNAQVTKQDNITSAEKNDLSYYHSFTAPKVKRSYQHVDYTLPKNQLNDWRNYPLTAAEIERRNKQEEEDNKLSNKIAKDIITSLLSKKKKVAVIPKF